MRARNNIPLKIVIFTSDEGKNVEAILEHNFIADRKNQNRDIQIEGVFCDTSDAKIIKKLESRRKAIPIGKSALKKAYKGNIHAMEQGSTEDSKMYEARLVAVLHHEYPDLDLIVFDEFKFNFSSEFVEMCYCPILSFVNYFPDGYCAVSYWNDYQQGRGAHGVVSISLLHGWTTDTLTTRSVPILDTDDYTRFERRMRTEETTILLETLQMLIHKIKRIYTGKVRDLYTLDNREELMLVRHSDRLSAHNKNICVIPGKGEVLCKTATWWFERTKDIVPNHYLYHMGSNMVVRRCRPILLEIVVRGYLTGNSDTSIWTMYNEGKREMYGYTFPDGMKKNQPLITPIITPTTKGDIDEPITDKEIIRRGILSEEQWYQVKDIALKLFARGTELAGYSGLILADTKYEFGFYNGQIILIDEIHTPDSSRYWYRMDYEANRLLDREPRKLDKDPIRDFVKANPEETHIPGKLIDQTLEAYQECYKRLVGMNVSKTVLNSCFYSVFNFYLHNVSQNIVVILAGSTSDREFVDEIRRELDSHCVTHVVHFASAHKEASKLLNILHNYRGRRIVYITVAGRSNALSGFVAGNQPDSIVIACPPFKSRTDLQLDINSSLMMPSNVPVMTVVGSKNAAQAAARILN